MGYMVIRLSGERKREADSEVELDPEGSEGGLHRVGHRKLGARIYKSKAQRQASMYEN